METDNVMQAAVRPPHTSPNVAHSAPREIKAEGGNNLPENAARSESTADVVARERLESRDKATEKKEVEEAALVVSDFLNTSQRGLEFSVNEDAGRTVVKVMDVKEEKVIRQIPSDEVLKLAQKVRELKAELSGKTGMLFESEA